MLIEGKETELDKTLIEAIKDPLTHLVRNAVDHGIEPPEERRKAGKNDMGQILIKAYHESGQVTIEITDDGRGLSRDKILKKALEKGLVAPERAETASDKEVFNFIFSPGFSTAEKVTNISGRGVGMDVVKTNIEKIGGFVDITSHTGKGSTLTLKIPLTLAIIPALIVKENQSSFAIPQNNIVELVRLDDERTHEIESVRGAQFFRLRGKLIPVMNLYKLLEIERDIPNNVEVSEKLELTKSENVKNIVVLNAEGRIYGLIVDQILDTQEIVVKPLSQQIKNLKLYAGATIMGDGTVALIIDAMGAAEFSRLQTQNEDKKQVMNSFNEEAQSYLLFRLNNKNRFAVPLILVNRLEEFKSDDVEFVGDQPIIKYRDKAMPLIFLSVEMGLRKDIDLELKEKENLPVFVVKLHNQLFGLVVDQILDIAESNNNLDSSVSGDDKIFGTLFVDENSITVIDTFYIIDQQKIVKKQIESKELDTKKNKDKTILVVEDSPMFRKLASGLLEENGYSVLSAVHGQEAIEILENNNSNINLILSDIEMPFMNGYQLAENVRANSHFSHLPMIAVTTRFSEDDKNKGKTAGFNLYLEKFKKDDVIAAVNQLLKEVG